MKFPFSLFLLCSPLFGGDSMLPILDHTEDIISSDSKSAKDAYRAKDIPLSQSKNSNWTLRSGPALRNIGRTTIDPGFQSSSDFSSNFFSPNPASGPLGQNSNRTYDNGFVNLGAATSGTGLTTNWGYQNPNQLSGNTLDFSLAGGVALSFPSPGTDGSDLETSPYLELAYISPLDHDLDIGFVANFFFSNLESSILNQIDQFSVTTTDSFNTGGILIPSAPFTGTFTGPGPLLPNQPINRDNTQTLSGSQIFQFESDINLYSIGFGSEILWHSNTESYISLGAGVVINIADWKAETSVPLINPTTLEVSNANFRDSDDEILLGLYLKIGVGQQINEHWNLEGFFRYDWNEDLNVDVGPTSVNVDLTGWSLGAAVGYSF